MLPTLYRPGKRGQTLQWSISTYGNVITTTHGELGGKLITHTEVIEEGKNIGRRNETTPEQQACLEAESLWRLKQKKGYSTEVADKIELPYVLPMLAEPYMKHRAKVRPGWRAQNKLNGIRCIVSRLGDNIRYTTRNGNEFFGLDFMTPGLLHLVPDGGMLDGELYVHGMTLQAISSMVRRTVNQDPALLASIMQYHVFDIVLPDTEFSERDEIVQGLFDAAAGYLDELYSRQVFHRVTSTTVYGEEDCNRLVDEAMAAGYEGIMLRNPRGLYLPSYRSYDLLKYKLMKDDEFRVVGGRYGRGKDKNIFIWRCVTESGKEFDVKMTGTYELNELRAKRHSLYIGKMMTVQFQELTEDGIPEFPVGLDFRDYE